MVSRQICRPGRTWRFGRCFVKSEASDLVEMRVRSVLAFHPARWDLAYLGGEKSGGEKSRGAFAQQPIGQLCRPGCTWRSGRCFVKSEASDLVESQVRSVLAFHPARWDLAYLSGEESCGAFAQQPIGQYCRPGCTWRFGRCFVKSEAIDLVEMQVRSVFGVSPCQVRPGLRWAVRNHAVLLLSNQSASLGETALMAIKARTFGGNTISILRF